nr:cardiolipin synthase [Lautropia sp.]
EDEIAWLSAWIEERARRSHPHDATMPKWWQDLMEGIVRAVGYQL